jgi:hypothetical protein
MAKKKMENPTKGQFPTFAVILLVLAIIWLLGDLGYIAINIPWIPIIIAIIAIGMIINRYTGK